MVKLLNGRGQLGDALKIELARRNVVADADIYHTWIHSNKGADVQLAQIHAFMRYVGASGSTSERKTDRRIYFISAIHERFNAYLKEKMWAEIYLWQNTVDGVVIRLPYMLGSGIAERMLAGQSISAGKIEVSTFETMAGRILDIIEAGGDERMHVLHGEMVDAQLLQAAMRFRR